MESCIIIKNTELSRACVLLCNLQGLYVFFLYGTKTTFTDVLVTLVFVYSRATVVHHFITYTQVGRMMGKNITSILRNAAHESKIFYNSRKVEPKEIELNIPMITGNFKSQ